MRHRLWVTLIALGALAAACYPEFDFSPKKKSGHHGSTSASSGGGASGTGGAGAGGAGGAQTTATSGGQGGSMDATSTSSTSTGSGGAVVPCGDQGTMCAPGQVCCVHKNDPTQDHCGAPGSCTSSFYEFTCDFDDDCDNGQLCCAVDTNGNGYVDTMQCGTCNGTFDELSCLSQDDCSPITTCKPFPHSDGRPGYATCQY